MSWEGLRMVEGTAVYAWNHAATAARDRVKGIYIGKGYDERNRVRLSDGRVEEFGHVEPLNSRRIEREKAGLAGKAFEAGRPLRRAAFIEFETAVFLERAAKKADVGNSLAYRMPCCRCREVSKDPAETWDHAIRCRGEEPTRKGLREKFAALTKYAGEQWMREHFNGTEGVSNV